MYCFFFFFFKQKTAYEIRKGDWSSDVCSSDLNTGLTPFPVAELYNIDFAQVDACARAIGENADIALGAKVRMSENVIAKHGTEPLKRAIMACEKSGTNGKIMVHIGGGETAKLM